MDKGSKRGEKMGYRTGGFNRGKGRTFSMRRRKRRRGRIAVQAVLILAVLLCGAGFALLVAKGPSLLAAVVPKTAQSESTAPSQEEISDGEGASSQPEKIQKDGDAVSSSFETSAGTGSLESSVLPEEPSGEETPVEAEAVDDSYFDDAAFIGNSRTQGLMLYTGLQNATFYTAQGLMVDTFFTKKVVGTGEGKLTIPDAMKQQNFKKVYIMLGINELGWSYEDVFIRKYGELIDEVKRLQPEATVFVQSIMPVSKSKSDRDKVYNNPRIDRYNELIQEMAKEKGAVYLNVAEAVGLDGGALPEEASTDGVHLNKEYCVKWLDYLKCHTGVQPG